MKYQLQLPAPPQVYQLTYPQPPSLGPDWGRITGAVVATGILTVLSGGLFSFFAPTIATWMGGAGLLGATATTGTTIATLKGVVLTNASLAAIGGGALITGGGGMATGAAVITKVGVASGAVVGTVGTINEINKTS